MASVRSVVSLKATKAGSGLSGVARYITDSKLDREREGRESRPLFNGTRSDLTYREANSLVSPDRGGPSKSDIIHLVISPSRGEYEKFGATEEERLEAFRGMTTDTLKELETALNIKKLHWFAGIHRNTETPHVHIGIGRDAATADGTRAIRIEHIPREFLPHNARVGDTKEFVPGKMAETFTAQMDSHQNLIRQQEAARNERQHDPAHQPETGHEIAAGSRDEQREDRNSGNNQPSRETSRPEDHTSRATGDGAASNSQPPASSTRGDEKHVTREALNGGNSDRYVLGRAMVARGEVERLSASLENAHEHGDKRRFRVHDDSKGRARYVSEFDFKRRADARAARLTNKLTIVDREERRQKREGFYENDLQVHTNGIANHHAILHKTIEKLEGELSQAQNTYAGLRREASLIKRRHDLDGRPLPTPLVTPRELFSLESQAVTARKPERLLMLEKIRFALAAEKGQPPRTDRDAARLQGQHVVARTDLTVRERRHADFERNRHLTRWEIDGEKWSLADVDRKLVEQRNRAKVFTKPTELIPRSIRSPVREGIRLIRAFHRTTNLLPSGRRAAAAEVARLTDVRLQVEAHIVERRDSLRGEVDKAAKMAETLSAIWGREAAARAERGQSIPAPSLSRAELNRLESNAHATKDSEMFRLFQTFEAAQLDNAAENKRPALLEETAGRAVAREIIADIALREAETQLWEFDERKQFAPVLTQAADGRDRTSALYDFKEPRSLTEYVTIRAFESSDDRQMRLDTESAVETHRAHLETEVDRARDFFQLCHESAEGHREIFNTAGREEPQPVFTRREVNAIELFAERQFDRDVFRAYDRLVELAETEGRVIEGQQEDRMRIELEGPGRDERGVLERSAGAAPPDHAHPGSEHFTPAADHDQTHMPDFTLEH